MYKTEVERIIKKKKKTKNKTDDERTSNGKQTDDLYKIADLFCVFF